MIVMSNRCYILKLRTNQSFVCNFLSVPRCKGQIAPKKTHCLSFLSRNFLNVLTPIQVDSYSKVFGRLNLFQSLLMQWVVNLYVLVRGCWVSLIEWHLATLNFISPLISHCASLFRSSCKIWQSMGDFIFLLKTQSSAKRRTDDLIFLVMIINKNEKYIGPALRQILGGHQIGPGTGVDLWPLKWNEVGLANFYTFLMWSGILQPWLLQEANL